MYRALRIPSDELSTRWGDKLTTCSWYLTRLNIAYARDRGSQQVGGCGLKSFPIRTARGGVTAVCIGFSTKRSLFLFDPRTASCRSSRNGASVGNPGETFRQLQKFTLPQRLSRFLSTRGGTLTGTPNRNYDRASTERSANSLVSRILFWRTLCREFSKVTSVSGPVSSRINVDNAISRATSGAHIFAFHATFCANWGQQ